MKITINDDPQNLDEEFTVTPDEMGILLLLLESWGADIGTSSATVNRQSKFQQNIRNSTIVPLTALPESGRIGLHSKQEKPMTTITIDLETLKPIELAALAAATDTHIDFEEYLGIVNTGIRNMGFEEFQKLLFETRRALITVRENHG